MRKHTNLEEKSFEIKRERICEKGYFSKCLTLHAVDKEKYEINQIIGKKWNMKRVPMWYMYPLRVAP